jgi:hypothetical protein
MRCPKCEGEIQCTVEIQQDWSLSKDGKRWERATSHGQTEKRYYCENDCAMWKMPGFPATQGITQLLDLVGFEHADGCWFEGTTR